MTAVAAGLILATGSRAQNAISRPVGISHVAIPAGACVPLANPFIPFNANINAVLAGQVVGGAALEEGEIDIYPFSPGANSYTPCFLLNLPGEMHHGKWVDENHDLAGFSMSQGCGFVARNNTSSIKPLFFTGRVVVQPARSITIQPGLQLIGYPYTTGIQLNQTTFSGEAHGAATEAEADTLGLPGAMNWLLDDSSSPNHGKWIGSDGRPSTLWLGTGLGYWLNNKTTNDYSCTESRPYAAAFPSAGTPDIESIEWIPGGSSGAVTLSILPPGGQGASLDLYCKDVPRTLATDPSSGWSFILTGYPTPAGAPVEFVDVGGGRAPPSTPDTRLYLAGNPGIDTDGDGVPDCRESCVYGTSPGTWTPSPEHSTQNPPVPPTAGSAWAANGLTPPSGGLGLVVLSPADGSVLR